MYRFIYRSGNVIMEQELFTDRVKAETRMHNVIVALDDAGNWCLDGEVCGNELFFYSVFNAGHDLDGYVSLIQEEEGK